MAGESLQHWSSILLQLAKDGLQRQHQCNAAGEDESIYLAPLWQITRNNASLARQWLESYQNRWGQQIEPMFTEARHL
jgi:glutamate--cysteine ligase